MTYIRPKFQHPALPKNELGYTRKEYEGTISTLCAGCGHDSISAAIVEACFELNIEPHKVAKLSGIGCSSKTPAYFLNQSHGFNSVHGRMPSIATGAYLANTDLTYLGVSGDGDSASIGMGQFVHAVRRSLNITYIVMNNGCYGLTKGQDSATADFGSVAKAGHKNIYEAVDLCGLAIELGAGFVAQSFSGDKKQLIPLIKAALSYNGFAFLNVLSPCVTFNNNTGSTKSYDYIREHNEVIAGLDYIQVREEITTHYADNTVREIELHDGSFVKLHKLQKDWNPQDKLQAITALNKSRANHEILTGLLYLDEKEQPLNELIRLTSKPLNTLSEQELNPGKKVLSEINTSFR